MRRSTWVVILLASESWGAFQEAPNGGRSAALDGALTAAPGDVFSVTANPAAVTDIGSPELGLHHGRFMRGLTDGSGLSRSFAGWASPSPWGSYALTYGRYALDDLYKEESLGITYARAAAGWRLGATAKHQRKTVKADSSQTAPDPSISARSASAWDGDLGVRWQANSRWRLAASVLNVLEADVGLSERDAVPRVLRLGAARQAPWASLFLDLSHRTLGGVSHDRVHAGLERWFGPLAARAGAGVGSRRYAHAALGFGARWGRLQLDYGFLTPLSAVKENGGNHQVSAILRFGGAPPPSETAPAEPAAISTEPAPGPEPIAPPPPAEASIAFRSEKWDVVVGGSTEARAALESVARFLKENPRARLQVDGHTDNKGPRAYNQVLSVRRAEAVRDLFVREFGVQPERIRTRGYGPDQPVAANSTLAGRARNRRAVFRIVLDGS